MSPTTETIADVILALERHALDRWGKGDTTGYLDLYADDVTYFDPLVGARIDGLEAMRVYYAPWAGRISIPRYEILNPQVVAAGDLALLTYNLVNYQRGADGKEATGSRWNCTEGYRRDGAQWKIVHSHWSFTQHSAFQNMTPEQSEGA
jgi:ketosteroid isomerase-like protein